MPFADLSGARIFYQQIGEGPDIVCIHGLAANHAFWFTRIAFALKRRFRLTLYDLRGHGRSSMPPSGYTSRDMAQDLGELMDQVGMAQAMLMGHSFGGKVALHFTALHRHRVWALVLADTRIYALQSVQRLSDAPVTSLEEELLRGSEIDGQNEQHMGMRLLEEWMAQRKSELPELPGAGFVPFGRESLRSRAAGDWLKLAQNTTARQDFREMAGLSEEKIRGVTVPLLAVYGQRSRCLPSGLALQSTVADCTLGIVPGAGHFHPLTRPRFFLRALARFLRDLQRRGAIPAGEGIARTRQQRAHPARGVDA